MKPSIKSGIDSSNPSQQAAKETKGSNKEELEMDDLLNLIDDDDNSNDSVKKSKSKSASSSSMKSPNKKRKRLSDDEESNDAPTTVSMGDDDDEDDLESIEKLKQKTYNSVKKELERAELEDEMLSVEDDSSKPVLTTRKLTPYYGASKAHAAIQPSSTPLNLPERYMVWNSTGIITQFNKEEDNSIEIEFHNASLHHTIHLKNQYGYTMADMSREVVALASPGSKFIDDELDK